MCGWCMELDFLRQPVIFINEVYDKISNRLNIPDPNEDNWQLLARLWDAAKRRGDGKCYCPFNAGDLRGEEYWSQ